MKVESKKDGSARRREEMPEMPVHFGIGQHGNEPRHLSFHTHVQNTPRSYLGEIDHEEVVEMLRQIITFEPDWIKAAADSLTERDLAKFNAIFRPSETQS